MVYIYIFNWIYLSNRKQCKLGNLERNNLEKLAVQQKTYLLLFIILIYNKWYI